jgi:hypothetical protein
MYDYINVLCNISGQYISLFKNKYNSYMTAVLLRSATAVHYLLCQA